MSTGPGVSARLYFHPQAHQACFPHPENKMLKMIPKFNLKVAGRHWLKWQVNKWPMPTQQRKWADFFFSLWRSESEGWGRPRVELFLSDGWNSCLYNIPKIAYIVFSTFLGECAAYVLKYWESFISTINLRKNGDTFYFSCRWEIPDNQVLLTKSWQQAAAHFSRKGDNGGKMAQAVSYFFSFLHPSNTQDFGRSGLWTEMPLPPWQRRNDS